MSSPAVHPSAEACCPPMVAGALGEPEAADLAPAFKALGDPVRLRLLSLIAARAGGEVCVCDLLAAFRQTAPTISHHLRVLRDAGLITSERRGSWVYYRVVPATLGTLSRLLDVSTMATGAARSQ